MILPAEHRGNDGRNDINRMERPTPTRHVHGVRPVEGEYVLMKDSCGAPNWYCAQIMEVLADLIVVAYHTTTAPPLANYTTATNNDRQENIMEAKYARTWITRTTRLTTHTAPRSSRIYKDLWTGRVPLAEIDGHLLIRNVAYDKGKLSKRTARLAAALTCPHHQGA